MIAHIQKHLGEFANINTLTACLGFREKGYEIRFFDAREIESLELRLDTPVAGGIAVVLAALHRLGVVVPELPSIPPTLEGYAGRRVWTTIMQEARTRAERGEAVFVKPASAGRKLFAGTVFKSFRDTIPTAHVPADYPVICSEPVDFVSEYRAFVLNHDLVGLRHYKGSCRCFPDIAVVDAAIVAYDPSPVAYGMDFGIAGNGKTLLVETNESYSLGCYGLPPLLYSTMLERRSNELTSISVTQR